MIRSLLNDQLAPIYQQRLDFADTNAGQGELACQELETILGVGALAFQNIRHRHLAWYADVQAKRVPYSVDDAQGFADEYQQWKDATEHWLAQVEEFETTGHEVDRAAEVRKFYEDIKLVNLDVRELVRRYESMEQGGGVEAGEFFASLRKRKPA
jgi:sulfur relay (sulfurtransferase) DsrC/TusE family protein